MSEYIPVEVVGVRVEMPSNQPIILVKEIAGTRYLPIWVGAVEASSIAFAQQQIAAARPLTHELFLNSLAALGHKVNKVYLNELRDGIFYAELIFESGEAISARPSDALALALRAQVPILARLELLAEAGVDIPGEPEDEVERFKEFLDHVSPEDFA
jgi:bifunctional DNase/RNase